MQTILVIVHVLISIALIIVVLLQTGKGADIGAVFGGSSQTLFGSSGGSTFFSKLTTIVAIIFMLSSLTLAYRSHQYGGESVMSNVKPAATAPASTEGQAEPAKAAAPAAPEAAKSSPPAAEKAAK
ncbi:MAG: preprotein translocase subunit SecG [Deltaproteobacteria bacterium]|nr:preprotein translocase subunit SecG [Deltaproteobacteria bacterium]MBW2070519.1 preprotein translocase subunit SecG [Deltaproteobacteria bacterium]